MSPEVEDCREGPHPLIECLETKCFLQGAIRLGAIHTHGDILLPTGKHARSLQRACSIDSGDRIGGA
jgi:hypothetical protein